MDLITLALAKKYADKKLATSLRPFDFCYDVVNEGLENGETYNTIDVEGDFSKELIQKIKITAIDVHDVYGNHWGVSETQEIDNILYQNGTYSFDVLVTSLWTEEEESKLVTIYFKLASNGESTYFQNIGIKGDFIKVWVFDGQFYFTVSHPQDYIIKKGKGSNSVQSIAATTPYWGPNVNVELEIDGVVYNIHDNPEIFDPISPEFREEAILNYKIHTYSGALGENSSVFGNGNTAKGANNLISGVRNYSEGTENTTFGHGNYNGGLISLVAGANNYLKGASNSHTIGMQNRIISATGSVVFGVQNNLFKGTYNTLIGRQLQLENKSYMTIIGQYNDKNIPQGSAIVFANGENESTRHNVFILPNSYGTYATLDTGLKITGKMVGEIAAEQFLIETKPTADKHVTTVEYVNEKLSEVAFTTKVSSTGYFDLLY